MEVTKYLNKIKLLFEYAFEGRIVINEYYKEKLLLLLEDRSENSPGKLILRTPDFYELIFRSAENLDKASNSLKVLLIEIVAIFFKNEIQLTKMQMQGFRTWLAVLDNLNFMPPHDLHLSCIKLATVQLTHCSEVGLMIEHKVWKNILYPNIHHKPKQISKAAYNFIAKLILKLNEYNKEPELLDILGYIVEPIRSSEYLNVPILDTESDAALSDKLLTYLNALVAVLMEADNHAPINKIISLLKDYFLLDHSLFEIFTATKNSCLLKILNTFYFHYFLQFYRHLLYDGKSDEFCKNMTAFHRNLIALTVKKREPFLIVDFVIQSNIIWSHYVKSHAEDFKSPLMYNRNDQEIDFSLQMIVNLMIPTLQYSKQQKLTKFQKLEITDVVEHFIVKLTQTVTDYILSSCYMFGQLIMEGGPNFSKLLTMHTMKELLRLRGHLTESQAGPLFQSLFYMFDIYIVCDEAGQLLVNENPMDPDDISLLSHWLNAMKMLLKEYNIPWYKNLEIVCVQCYLLNLLQLKFLTNKLVVQVLDLINICVNKFISPNMSLLVDNKRTQASTLNEIGVIMKLYMQHEDWEVRDSALNLLNSCMEICFIKYISLQSVIKENNLVTLAAKAALSDPEFYSRCTALKCLTAATKIDSIWQEVLTNYAHIYPQLVYILKNHSESMVRKEAASVLIGVYVNKKIEPRCQNILYEAMLSAALDDLDCEVQLAALKFWKCAIHKEMTYRGMFGGKFPSVTFSSEKKKIVVLNDAEIQKQLNGIMTNLSSIGCLTVLSECMHEVHSVEVRSQAYRIANKLINILDSYNYSKVSDHVDIQSVETLPTFVKPENIEATDFSSAAIEERDKVIDSILRLDQSELIINLHNNYCEMKSEEMDIDYMYCQKRKFVNPNMFIENFRNNDYFLLIENKKKCNADCVRTLDELVDEILYSSVND